MKRHSKRERHGQTHPNYRLWCNMIARCQTPSSASFHRYGGRGIEVCERWHTFTNFAEDMGERPAGTTLDRIDPNGHYEPSNCRWASRIQQSNNRANNVLLSYRGETKSATEWARELGLSPVTVQTRLRRGASVEAALQPVLKSKRPALRISRP